MWNAINIFNRGGNFPLYASVKDTDIISLSRVLNKSYPDASLLLEGISQTSSHPHFVWGLYDRQTGFTDLVL